MVISIWQHSFPDDKLFPFLTIYIFKRGRRTKKYVGKKVIHQRNAKFNKLLFFRSLSFSFMFLMLMLLTSCTNFLHRSKLFSSYNNSKQTKKSFILNINLFNTVIELPNCSEICFTIPNFLIPIYQILFSCQVKLLIFFYLFTDKYYYWPR